MSVEVPEQAAHGRFLKAGLTRYSYEDIVAAIQEFELQAQEYDGLAVRAFEIVGEHDAYLGSIGYAPGHIRALYHQMHSGFIPSIQLGDSNEHWPVKTWQKATASYRALNRKVRKAIAEAEDKEKQYGHSF